MSDIGTAELSVLLDDILAADERIREHLPISPLISLPRTSEIVGREVLCKLDTLLPTGSFKVRGALNAIIAKKEKTLKSGVVAFSTGNHGAAVAWAARRLGTTARIHVSEMVAPNKLALLERLGADVRISGTSQDDAENAAYEDVSKNGAVLVPAFSDPFVIAGQGVVAKEILDARSDISQIIVPLSGGGLASGVLTYAKSSNRSIEVFGVTMDQGAAMYESLKAGHPIQVPEYASLADSLGGGIGGSESLTFPIVQALLDDAFLVNEQEISDAMRYAALEEGLVLEGAGATPFALLFQRSVQERSGPIVLLGCGRNVSSSNLSKVLEASQGSQA
ncbi:MAG: pyridoxal-phosphate dependent enzyme [Pseudomonadota bacterium]